MTERTPTFGGEPRGSDGVASSSAPKRLGPYELLRPIAAGGMAEVWVAVRRGEFGFRQTFALKMIRPELAKEPGFRTMFLDEARLASHIRHTHVVPVLDLGENGDVVYQAMPLVDGGSVASLVQKVAEREEPAALPLGVSIKIVVDAARGLHAAHEATDESGRRLELVHRDVSPQNILVGYDGVTKVADFGIAKAIGLVGSNTEAGRVKGKRAYLAPEQVRASSVDRRCDVFSLGVIAWELLAARRLFKNGDAAMFFELTDRVPDVGRERSSVPPAIAACVARALEPSCEARFPTAEAFADALEDAAREARIDHSARLVAAAVVDLLGPGVPSDHWNLVELPLAPDEGTNAPTASNETRARPRRSGLTLLAGGLVVLVVGGAGFVAAGRSRSAGSPEAVAPLTPLPSPEPPVVVEATSAAPSSSSSSSSASAPPASGAAGPTVRRFPKTPPSPAPRPKFSKNPYD